MDFPKSHAFADRHIGPNNHSIKSMLKEVNFEKLDQLIDATVPKSIRLAKKLNLAPAQSEAQALASLKKIVSKNKIFKSYIGMGYYDCIMPAVIQRNILENPGWYTQYTPYQAEIAQGRLESLLNFQTMIIDLTGLPVANASMLDEGTAAAEAMAICEAAKKEKTSGVFFIASDCLPQTIDVVKTRAEAKGFQVVIGDHQTFKFDQYVFGALLQYPNVDGEIFDYRTFIEKVHQQNGLVVMAADLLALTLLTPPGELGCDLAVGTSQRFGIPLGFGGPHAGYLATKSDFLRRVPGRMVGVSKDRQGRPAIRLSLQTREQHIRREKATSNICTSQVLLANMSAMFAAYHGPEGLKAIAERIGMFTQALFHALQEAGINVASKDFFDTLRLEFKEPLEVEAIEKRAQEAQINLRKISSSAIGLSLDETTSIDDLAILFQVITGETKSVEFGCHRGHVPEKLRRTSTFLTHPTFNTYHSETELMRYIRRLESSDLSLTTSMIPLGSCTMKLNAASELMPVSWPEISKLHPFAPGFQTKGSIEMITQLERLLCELTGFAAFSLQPNSGAQGEYAGLLVIKKYHEKNNQRSRNICLIPSSAHGTNPASAVMAGMKVVVVNCDKQGNIDLEDLKLKAEKHRNELSALMVTYPSTHGVFEEGIREICSIIHNNGGQVYMDGANMNAQIGLCLPGEFGPDVCHLNLHKTFCIPHGGGGPGVGPIGVAAHLKSFLPNHPVVDIGNKDDGLGSIAAAPFGSASILPISWMYINMMGAEGLTKATKVAILNANYMASRLKDHYPILYKGRGGLVAHECIIDLRALKRSADVDVEDVAKRLMDYGFHAPTVAWPVAGTLMIEPTESESKEELDRFCDALIAIRKEIADIEQGKADKANNVLKNAPHTALMVTSDSWDFPYSRELAAFPAAWIKQNKFWPKVGRIDGAYGDRNFVCSCPPVSEYA